MGGGQAFHLQPRDLQAEKILAEGKNNSIIPGRLLQGSLKMAFYSSKTFGFFRSCFDDELYNYAANKIELSQNTAYAYSVLGVVKVLQDVEISNGNRPLYRDMQNLLEQDFCRMHDDSLIIDRFKRYFTAVVIIIMKKNKNVENFQILSVSDANAKISQPDWWQQFGICHVIESYAGQLKLVVKAVVDGDVQIMLSAPLVRDKQDSSKRIPCWIDYTSFVVNGKEHLNTSAPAWHNKPYEYLINVKAGDEIKIQVEWLPHRSDT